MAVDAARAAFIKNEYRWSTADSAVVKGRDASALSVEVPANVDATTAQTLANLILAQNDTPRVFPLTIEGIMLPDDFIGGVPRYTLDVPKYSTSGTTQRAMTFTCDLNTGIATVKVHG